MNFTKRKITPGSNKNIQNTKKRTIKKRYTKKNYTKKKKSGNFILKFILISIFLFIILFGIGSFILYQKYIKDLPSSIEELKNLEIAESTTIYDRNGGELYKIFKEKRTYIDFEDISSNMINALVAGEDKRYWENPGVDLIGLIRAVIYRVIGKTDSIGGTSTLTQQLIRNTILTNERTIERKIKEIYLSYKLSSSLSKEKILELYLNKIAFGHNAYGIEQASKTFFGLNAKNLGILESSILASLPKGPTYYSPYNYPERTVGYLYFYPKTENENITEIVTYTDVENNQEIVDYFYNYLKELKTKKLEGTTRGLICGVYPNDFKINLRIDNDSCTISEYSDLLNFLNGIKLEYGDYYIEYQTGRKDFILGRMLEDNYITFNEYIDAITSGIGYKFNEVIEKIDSPHFVFYIKEYLEEKYGEDVVEAGGLKVYTTLDPEKQQKAEELIEKYSATNKEKFDANNAALISIDNKTGQIVAMVGSRDYFDSENKGNVNIITSKLQPGSTFKPFVYNLGMANKAIGTKTPIYDLETEFSSQYTPANYDGKFMGKINISTALNNSRNIPAVKMLYMAGGEENVVNFMESLGVTSLNHNGQYGAPLALGTGEMTPLELANAYTVYANMGEKKEITAILKIIDGKGNTIEEYQDSTGEQVIPEAQAYINNYILSDTSSRPESRNSFLALKDRIIAAKTGTSTKQFTTNGIKSIYPSNLWTIGYTPSYTTVVWAGNTNGEKLNYLGNGLEGAGPIMHDYMNYVHNGIKAEKWEEPKGIEKINISEISGLLPNPENKSSNYLVESLFLNKPEAYDNSFKNVKIDILCNGLVSENTPEAAIKEMTLVELHSLYPTNSDWEEPVFERSKSEAFIKKYGNIPNLITSLNNNSCERSGIVSKIAVKTNIVENKVFSIGTNYIEFAYASNNTLLKAEILINGNVVDEIDLSNKKEGTYKGYFNISSSYSNKKVKITIRILDTQYYSTNTESINIVVLEKDITAPIIELENPIDGDIKIYEGTFFNLKANVFDDSNIRTINIRIDGTTVVTGITDRYISYPVNINKDLSIGNHIVEIEVIDKNFNKTKQNINVEVLKK